MYYADIKDVDVANGPGVRVSLFVSGCSHHCPGCFNPEAWVYNYGQEFRDETVSKIINLLSSDNIEGLTILGGEPLDPLNICTVVDLIQSVRYTYERSKTIWVYTGYTFEELIEQVNNRCDLNNAIATVLHDIDVLVDGRFVQDLHDPRLKFRGSSNQRILDSWLSYISHVPVYLDPKDCPRKEKIHI